MAFFLFTSVCLLTRVCYYLFLTLKRRHPPPDQKKKVNLLFTGLSRSVWEKNCTLGLEYACGLGPYSRPRAQFFPIRTSRPVNNIYICVTKFSTYLFSARSAWNVVLASTCSGMSLVCKIICAVGSYWYISQRLIGIHPSGCERHRI